MCIERFPLDGVVVRVSDARSCGGGGGWCVDGGGSSSGGGGCVHHRGAVTIAASIARARSQGGLLGTRHLSPRGDREHGWPARE